MSPPFPGYMITVINYHYTIFAGQPPIMRILPGSEFHYMNDCTKLQIILVVSVLALL
jgi:hypothetical protein